jgi:predicted deacetylase
MIPLPAQYLLRFDDLCPTYSRARFDRFVPMMCEFGIRPILAVVPDNMDPELEVSGPDSDFWAQMRELETAGATIGLHGYQHICVNTGAGLVPFHRNSEFAGVAFNTQRAWIRAGLAILHGHGLNPRIWVAPRHGFDRNTVRALREEGIGLISDGMALVPFMREGAIWIPQQLWAPVEKSKGLWTICVHGSKASDAFVDTLHDFLREHAEQFTSVERVVAEFHPTRLSLTQGLYGAAALWRKRGSHMWQRRRESDIL